MFSAKGKTYMSAHADRLKRYLQQLQPGGLEGLMVDRRREEAMPASENAREAHRAADSGLERLALGRDLTGDEMFHIEAIIIPDKRPAIDVRGGKFEIVHPLWQHLA